ncbi:YaaL family protein [Virgibacillus sediminis]|uniref:YaaL family protein n=1 Tax=Virgibacillus sediminis TaxID=202260 RepID=A0ABV7A717_9BACI
MGKKIRKRDVDSQLLEAIFSVEKEWKDVESMVERSIEPSYNSRQLTALARARYMFLLREARHRKLSAMKV